MLFSIALWIIVGEIAEMKGYSQGWWTLWGALFGILALIIIAIKPNKIKAKVEFSERKSNNKNPWEKY